MVSELQKHVNSFRESNPKLVKKVEKENEQLFKTTLFDLFANQDYSISHYEICPVDDYLEISIRFTNGEKPFEGAQIKKANVDFVKILECMMKQGDK